MLSQNNLIHLICNFYVKKKLVLLTNKKSKAFFQATADRDKCLQYHTNLSSIH